MLHDDRGTTTWDHRRMRDLPSGTVTFLFTDVEGSTRLLQERAEHYDPIMATHRDLIRTEPSVFATSLRWQMIASTADPV